MADNIFDRLHGLDSSYGTSQVPAGSASAKTSRIQQLLDANPYRNVTYTQSPWQKLLHALGFRTQADAWNENMTIQANEYDAALLQKEADEMYNSPAQQMSRMTAAGLNPELNGGQSIDSGSAAQMGEDPSTPMQSTGDELPLAVANQILGAFSSAIGMIGSFQGMQRNHLQNTLLELDTEEKRSNFFGSLSGLMLPTSDHPDGVQNFDWKSAALKNARGFSRTLPKKMQKEFIDYQERFFNSALGEGESFDAFRKRVLAGRGNAVESGTFWTEINEVLPDVVEPLIEFNEKQVKRQSKQEDVMLKEANNAESYQDAAKEFGLPKAQAGTELQQFGADNATASRIQHEQETIDDLNKSVMDIIKRLESHAHDGGIKGGLSNIALVLISGIRLWLANVGAPSISRSSSFGSSDSWSKFGHSASSSGSRGFSIGF